LARARAPFICQSQSLNIYMADPSYNKLTSSHFHAWSLGLKTGQYYLRSRPSRDAIKFTLNIESLLNNVETAGLYDHMATKNLNQAEMDVISKKRRKLNEISKSENEAPNTMVSIQPSGMK
jgi:ribonucleotide reductase alpha subunit